MNHSQMKRVKIGTYTAVLTVLALAVLLIVNIVAGELPSRFTRFDTSDLGYYDLSDYTNEVVSNVSESVTVYHIAQEANRDPVLTELLARYAQGSANIRVEQIDPAFHADFTVQYTDEVLEDNSLIVTSARRSRIVRYADVIRTEDVTDAQTGEQGQRSVFCGESALTGAVQFVTAQKVPTVCMVTGHDEMITDSMLAQIEYSGYDYKEIYLTDGISAECDCLLVHAPGADYTKDEIAVLRTYLSDGGKMLLVSPVYTVSAPNLAAFMQSCGAASLLNCVITENDGSYFLNGDTHALKPYAEPSAILNRTGSGIFTAFFGAHPIASVPAEGWEYTALLTTSESSYITTGDTSSGTNRFNGPFQVAAMLTNTRGGQVIWFSTPAVLMDAYDSLCAGGNTRFYMASLDELCRRETSVTVASKVMQVQALNVDSASATLWSVLLVGVIPVGILAAGGLVWYHRKNRK